MLGPVALTPAGPGDIVLAPGLLSSPPTSSVLSVEQGHVAVDLGEKVDALVPLLKV